MDMNLLNALSDQQKSEYLAITRTLDGPGWDILSKYYQDRVADLTLAGANASSWEDNRFILGQRLGYEEIANLREAIEERFEELALEASTTTESEDEERFE